MEGQFLNLSFSWLLLLPLIAGVLIFQGAWLDDGISARGRPKKYQRRLKAKILIHRALIINLLLATFFVFTSSFTVLPDIVQGLLLTAVLTLPVLIYLLFIVYKWRFKKKLPAGDSAARSELASSRIQSTGTPQVSLPGVGSLTLERSTTEATTQTRSVESLQAKPLENHYGDSSIEKSVQPLTNQETTPAPSYKELTEMVVSLQKKELKLEKLVIAQKAVINTEKQRNQKAQLLAQNAMMLMSKTKEGARVAIRVAQQERKERLRLAADTAKEGRQLENGPSPTHVKNTANH